MQAIETKYLCPTNSRGARIKATCAGSSVTISYPYDISGHARHRQACHRQAAEALRDKLGWSGDLLGGCLPSGNYCFIFDNDWSKE